ncbi:MAG: hypothetical protein S4CHLAM102_01150 [Chlamydiia bacterium]|nr:hypothetical protein [Chlamydiia bacterium]
MPISFVSNNYYDVMLSAGVNITPVIHANATVFSESQRREYIQSYTQYSQSLNLNFDQYACKFEASIPALKLLRFDHLRNAISGKLSELASRQIESEKHMGMFERFFEKIGQWFAGHGFQTRGEWGQMMAWQYTQGRDKDYRQSIHACLYHSTGIRYNELPPCDVLDSEKDRINGLSPDEFAKLLDEAYFQGNSPTSFGKRPKMVFYQNLTPEKKEQFMNAMLSNPSSTSYLLDLINYCDNGEIDTFVSEQKEKILMAYGSNLQPFRRALDQNPNNTWFQDFVKQLRS